MKLCVRNGRSSSRQVRNCHHLKVQLINLEVGQMSAQIQPGDLDLSSLMMKDKPKTINDTLHEVKAELSKQIQEWAFRLGLGYTTLTESYDKHNTDLFREIVLEAQAAQRADPNELFSSIVKGNLYEVIAALDRIENSVKECINMKYNVEENKDVDGTYTAELEKELRLSKIHAHDVAGANIVHVAYLFMHYKIGHYLVKRYPKLACEPYSDDVKWLVGYINPEGSKKNESALYKKWLALRESLALKDDDNAPFEARMPYTGENILHITIIRRNYEEVRWLLEFYRDHRYSHPGCLGKLLNAHATGQFFDRRGAFYFGSNPLQFAVCCNSTNIFDLVYSFVSREDEGFEVNPELDDRQTSVVSVVGPDVIFSTDNLGNNILHLCVLHALDKMYEHVHATALQVMSRAVHYNYILRRENNPGDQGDFALPKVVNWDTPTGFMMKETLVDMPTRATVDLPAWLLERARTKVDERLVLALNKDFHSPLTLAASIIEKDSDSEKVLARKKEMFQFLVEKMKVKLWSYGPVTMSILNLEGIEIKYDVKHNYDVKDREEELDDSAVHSALWWLCSNDANDAVNVPEIRQLIQAKWERVGYPLFILSFLLHGFLTTCVTLILIFINATPTTDVGYSTAMIANVLYSIVAIAFFIMMIQEIHDIIVFRARLISFRGVPLYDKVLRICKIVAFIAFCCCKAVETSKGHLDQRYSVNGAKVLFNVDDDQGVKVTIVVCVIACYFHLYYFFMGFDSTGPFVLTMFRIISRDVPYFMNFYLIVVVAFGCALSVLSNDHNSGAGYGFFHLLKAVWTLIQDTVGITATHDNINTMDKYPQHLQWLADILLTMYNITVIILMLNLLIAMISNTYNAYCEYNDAILLMAKYDIMSAMEWVMGPQERKESYAKYAQVNEQQLRKTLTERSAIRSKAKATRQVMAGPVVCEFDDEVKETNSSSELRVQRPSRHGAPTLAELQQINKEDIEHQRLTRYLFKMQTVNDTWCDESDTGMLNPIVVETKVAALVEKAPPPSAVQSRKTTLFIICPQNDFHEGGSLAVPGAYNDSTRVATMIDEYGDHIHDIIVSMDSHNPCHIAHACSWHRPGDCHAHPAVFTTITNEDVVKGVWVYRDPSQRMQDWVKFYTAALERKDKMVLTIWPEHCLIGSTGHSVVPVIHQALQRWASRANREVTFVMKGQNLRVEMYSALTSEVEDPYDQNTAFDHALMANLQSSDRLLICGQAMSHCVNYTTRDILHRWAKHPACVMLLTDGSSPVFGYDVESEEFMRYCQQKGAVLATTDGANGSVHAFAGCRSN